MKSIIPYLKYLKSKLKGEYDFFRTLNRQTGIRYPEYMRLRFGKSVKNLTLFGKKIEAPDAFWHLHSLNEIFVEEVYRFKPKTTEPFILDCGSNIGLSIIYFKQKFPKAKVLGFEPDPAIFKMLEYNLSRFHLSDVEIRNAAVWVSDEDLLFNSTGALGGSLDLNGNNSVTAENKVRVKATRLRNHLVKQKVDFLKIDVEGAEFELIDDLLDVLNHVDNLFIEYHRPRGAKIPVGDFLTKLENCGFKVYIKEAWNSLPHPYCHDDYRPTFDLQLNVFAYRE